MGVPVEWDGSKWTCGRCGCHVLPGWTWCPFCGVELGEPADDPDEEPLGVDFEREEEPGS